MPIKETKKKEEETVVEKKKDIIPTTDANQANNLKSQGYVVIEQKPFKGVMTWVLEKCE